MKYLAILSFLLLVYSCQKEEAVLEDLITPTEETQGEERFEDGFSDYTAEIGVGITSHSTCGTAKISQTFEYKMHPAVSSGGKYFYKIKRKSDYDYYVGSHSTEWVETDGYYRYDYENKISYHYTDTADANPQVLMDFNMTIGDSILIDGTPGITAIYFKVDNLEAITFDGQGYPALRGHLVCDQQHFYHNGYFNQASPSIQVSPLYPNPIFIDNTLGYYYNHDWTEDNFGGALLSAGPTHADKFSFFLKDDQSSGLISSYGLWTH